MGGQMANLQGGYFFLSRDAHLKTGVLLIHGFDSALMAGFG